MLAMWHRVLTRPVRFSPNAKASRRVALNKAIRAVDCRLVVDEVWRWAVEFGKQDVPFSELGPAVPVSENCWLEYTQDNGKQVGVSVVSARTRHASGIPTKALFTVFLVQNGDPYCADAREVHVAADGTCLGVVDKPSDFTTGGIGEDELVGVVSACIYAFGFAHANNVTTKEAAGHGPTEKWCRRQNAPLVVYRRLVIPGSRVQYDSAGGATGVKMRVHICRGHFKTYTAEARLFGKYVGKF